MVIGGSCAEALSNLYYFEKACKVQIEMMSMRLDPKKCAMSDEQAEKIHKHSMENKTKTSLAIFNAWKNAGI